MNVRINPNFKSRCRGRRPNPIFLIMNNLLKQNHTFPLLNDSLIVADSLFFNPIKKIGRVMYRFYLIDTIFVQGLPHADIVFINKQNGLPNFQGKLLVKLDSHEKAYLLKSIKFKIKDQWISAFKTEEPAYEEWNNKQDH